MMVGKQWAKNIAVLLGLLSTTFIICMMSPLDIFTQNGVSDLDSSVFQYIGSVMMKGGVPYRDTFDHKGLLLYMINFLGIKISEQHGIWFLELAFMFLSVSGIYKITRLFAGEIASLFNVFIVLALLKFYFEGGNLTEEYALPMQIWSLYIYIDYFKNNKINNFRVILCGALFVAVCFIRVNMISVWIAFSFMVLIKCVYEKLYEELLDFMFRFILGGAIVLVPLVLYLMINQAFSDFVEAYWNFNKLYAKASFISQFKVSLAFVNQPVTWIALFVAVVYSIKAKSLNDKLFHYGYIGYLIITLILLSMSGSMFAHYGMTLLPALIYPYSQILKNCSKEKMLQVSAEALIVMYILLHIVIPNWNDMLIGVADTIANYESDNRTGDFWALIDYIKEHTSELDAITVYGNGNSIYNMSHRVSASKYSYQYPIGYADASVFDRYFDDLSVTVPKLIVANTATPDGRMSEYLNQYGFTQTQQFGGNYVFEQTVAR